MKRIMLGAAVALFLYSSCSPGGGNTYTLNGKLTNLKDSVLYLARQENGMPSFDTLKVTNGTFSFKGKTDTPVLAQIITPDQRSGFALYLEPGHIDITGNADSMMTAGVKVTGTPDNDDLQEFMAIQKPFIPQMMSMQQEYMKAKMTGDTATISHIQHTSDSIQQVVTSRWKSFIRKHPKSQVSALALQSMMNDLDDSTLQSLYATMDTSIQHSTFGDLIGKRLADEKKTSIGQQAPDFTMNDTTGKPVSLASFRGKYVLVDFWASWCGPCRAENPNVVKAYQKYKDKNFTILGVSLDRTKDAWEKAIKDDHLTWHHVSDLQYWDNAAAKLYGVQAIPANFLIGPKGKIIAKNLRGDELEQELAQVLQ